MLEMRPTVERPQHLVEEEVDALLLRGDILNAAHVIGELGQGDNTQAFSHTDFKALSLPLYELAFHPATEARIDAANDTYGLLAGLIETELAKLAQAEPKDRGDYLGRLGELTIFSLFLRDGIHPDAVTVPVPATRQADKYGAIDFYLTPVGTGRINDGWPFQVKLSNYGAEEHRKKSSIPVVSLETLDGRFYRKPEHPRSLPQRLLRELEGTSTDSDLGRLAHATSALYETVLENKKVRSARRRNWELGKMARRFFADLTPDLQPATA